MITEIYFCPICGKELINSSYCHNCGFKLKSLKNSSKNNLNEDIYKKDDIKILDNPENNIKDFSFLDKNNKMKTPLNTQKIEPQRKNFNFLNKINEKTNENRTQEIPKNIKTNNTQLNKFSRTQESNIELNRTNNIHNQKIKPQRKNFNFLNEKNEKRTEKSTNQTHHTLEINNAPLEELSKIPGLNRELAHKIINLRNSGIYIHSFEDLFQKLNLNSEQKQMIKNNFTPEENNLSKGRLLDL